VKLSWILYWNNGQGVAPLNLIATFETRERAEHFLYRSGTFIPADWDHIGLISCPRR
jgi:hypothetical protein